MIGTSEKVSVNRMHKAVLQTVLYFDIFKYPLMESEIAENCSISATLEEVKQSISELVTLGYLKLVKGYYMPHWADINNVQRREEGNERASEMLKIAYEYSKKASRLPFVKGLCISGSLSKNFVDNKSDVDFFVITNANRLWVCRSLFVIFYKTLPEWKRKFYCLNYFISEADLRIDDRNIFVATELAYLIPTFNYDMYTQLLQKNDWYREWFVHKAQSGNDKCEERKGGFLKTVIESVFSGRFGNWCDERLQRATAARWGKRYADLDKQKFEIQFRSRKHVAKRHEKGYQDKVLKTLEQKMKDLEDTFQQKLN